MVVLAREVQRRRLMARLLVRHLAEMQRVAQSRRPSDRDKPKIRPLRAAMRLLVLLRVAMSFRS